MLEPLGVRDADERVYRDLLARPNATIDELSRASRAGRSTVAAGLERLDRLGLVRRSGGKPVRYRPVPPDAAIDALIRRRHEELDRLRLDSNELVADYYASTISRERPGLFEIIAGGDEVLKHVRALERAATTEILSFDKPPFLVETLTDHDEVANESPILARGVAVRAIYTAAALDDGDRFSRVDALTQQGEEARVLPDLPMKLRIFDRQLALVPLGVDIGVMHTVAVLRRSALLEALVALFELLWERAAPLGTPPAKRATPGVGDDAQRVIGMLAAGMSDEAIARQLGVSARTARRRVQRLYGLLSASTPFQAGAAAVRAGHLR